jgi:hypothetical protein
MEGYGVLSNASEPEYAANVISSLLEPFDEFPDRESLTTYYNNIFHDKRDIDLYLTIDKYARHAYEPQGAAPGGYFANIIKSKSPAEMVQNYSKMFNQVVEKYIAPNYEYMSEHQN